MATPILINTSGATNANVYPSLAEAHAYFDTQLYATNWTGSYADQQNKALLMATRLIDEQIIWNGQKYSEIQSLRWPRDGIYDPDGYYVSSTIIPQFLKNAVAELAGQLIGSNRTAESDTKGFKRLKAGELELEIDKTDVPEVLPDSVWEMVRHYGIKRSEMNVDLVRV